MAKPLKYPKKRLVALSEETDKKLIKIAVKNETTPTAYIRVIVEKELGK